MLIFKNKIESKENINIFKYSGKENNVGAAS